MKKSIRVKKTKQKAILVAGILTTTAALGISSHLTFLDVLNTNASKDSGVVEKVTGGYIREDFDEIHVTGVTGDYEEGVLLYSASSSNNAENNIVGSETTLPSKFDPREKNSGKFLTKQENQAGENICWTYAFTTTAETFLKKKGIAADVELSPKHLDYITAKASSALVETGAKNIYSDFLKNARGAERSVGDGGNYFVASVASTGSYALTDESSFYQKMKLNDSSTLGSYGTYGEFILSRTELKQDQWIYKKQQKTADVFSEESSEYIVDGSKYIVSENYYSLNLDQDDSQKATIQKVKNAINEYGAVAVMTNYNEDKCMYSIENPDDGSFGYLRTIIDRSTSDNSTACNNEKGSTGHGITLVGWDDDWSYKDGTTSKKGAFIVQNSYGPRDEYYLSYNSPIMAFVITSMKKRSEFDDVLDVTDYKETTDSMKNTLTFDYENQGKKTLKELVFSIIDVDSSTLKWDIYVKSGNEEYQLIASIDFKTGREGISFENIENLTKNIDGNISVQMRLSKENVNFIGLDQFAKYVTMSLYLDDGNVEVVCSDDEELVDGTCKKKTTPAPTCTADEELVNGECKKKTTTPTCAADEELIDGTCKKKTTPAPTCNDNEELVNGKCEKKSLNIGTDSSKNNKSNSGSGTTTSEKKDVSSSNTGQNTSDKGFAIENMMLISAATASVTTFAIIAGTYARRRNLR